MSCKIPSICLLLLLAPTGLAQSAVGDPPAPPQDASTPKPARWNQWRGPARSGQYFGARWPERLSPANFTRQWREPAGPSYSGPVVDDRLVFTTATLDREREIVRALDRRTGKEVWRAEWKGAVTVPFFAKRNGSWIRSTPVHDGESLFVAGMRDVLVCLAAATGKERWRVDFTKRFGTKRQAFGFVCSPLVHDGFVYVQCGAGLVKLDKNTGETAWLSMKDRGGMFGGAFSSPVLAKLRGKPQLLVQSRTALNGVDHDSGTVLWSVAVKSFRGMNILTPMPYGDAVFTSAYGGRGHLFQVTRTKDAFTVAEKWMSRAQGYMTSPVVIDGHAYLYLRSKRFCCVELATGKRTWVSKPLGDTYWSLVAQGSRILALGDSGELYLIAANPKQLEPIDRIRVADSETWAHLAVDADQVFIRELDGLSAYRWR
ncbi:MAG: PQQ-binding-like beta-propeller repeat protein [Planctomycetota bacterium]|jgi:outer membrane protein assembly factor BamB